jgi:hypothetical protein
MMFSWPHQLLVARVLGAEHLHRHALAEDHVLAEVDGAHAALAELLDDAVALPEGLPDEARLGRQRGPVERADQDPLLTMRSAGGAERHTRAPLLD